MHLRDLSEADLPENQRGLVISEIALFRERASVKRAEPVAGLRGVPPPEPSRSAGVGGFTGAGGMATVPSGPKERAWGRGRRESSDSHQNEKKQQTPLGNGPQGYQKSPGFVKGQSAAPESQTDKTDEELERERIAVRKREEDESFRDVSICQYAMPLLVKSDCALISVSVDGRAANIQE
jgi:RNA-binding protein 25